MKYGFLRENERNWWIMQWLDENKNVNYMGWLKHTRFNKNWMNFKVEDEVNRFGDLVACMRVKEMKGYMSTSERMCQPVKVICQNILKRIPKN